MQTESSLQGGNGIQGRTERPTQTVTQEAPRDDFEFPQAAEIQPIEAPSDYRTNLIAELRRLKRLGIF